MHTMGSTAPLPSFQSGFSTGLPAATDWLRQYFSQACRRADHPHSGEGTAEQPPRNPALANAGDALPPPVGFGAWEWDLASGDFVADPALKRILGVLDDELPNRIDCWSRLIHPDDRDGFHAAVQAYLAGTVTVLEIGFRMVHRDGSARRFLARGLCRRGPDGRPHRLLGTQIDVTTASEAGSLDDGDVRYRLLAEHSTDLISTHDIQGRYIYASPSCISMLGHDPWQLRGRSALCVVHPDDLAEVAQLHATLFERKEAEELRVTFRALRSDGGFVWVESSYKAVRDVQGRPFGSVCVTRDISRTKAAEDRLRQSEARLRALVELSSDWYYEQDEHLRFVAISEGFSRSFGMRAEGVLGRTRWEVPGMVVSDAERQTLDAIHAAQQPFRDVPITRRRQDGSIRRVSISGIPIFDAAGKFCGYRGVGRDITEQEALREAVVENERRMRLALEYGKVGVWERDLGTEVLRWSPNVGPMMGLPHGTSDVPIAELFARYHPQDRERLNCNAGGVSEAQLEAGFEHRIVWPDGSVRWVFQRGRIVRSPDGRAQGRLGIIQDITERKETEFALRASEDRCRMLMELSSDYYWEQDAQFRFTVFQQGTFSKGLPPTEACIGKTRWESDRLIPPVEGWAVHRALLERHLPFQELTLRFRFDSGEVRTLCVSGAPVFDQGGTFIGYRGVSRDITERERAHRRLQESEARFRALTGLSSDWYWEQDPESRFTMISGNIYRMMKWAPGTYIGVTRWDIPYSEVSDEVWAEHKRTVALRRPFHDLMLQRLDGEGRMHTHSVSGSPMFDQDGVFRGYRGIGRDVTAAKAAESALRESEQRFRLWAERTRDIVWICDPDLARFDYVSPAIEEVCGVSVEAFMARPSIWKELVHLDDLDRTVTALEGQTGEKPVDIEFRIVRPDGELRWLCVRTTPTHNSRGEVVVCGITEDITRQKLDHLANLEEAVRQRDMLVREVHHRIKNGLQGVAGLLRSHALRDAVAAPSLETAISQVQAIATVHGLQGMGKGGGVDIGRVAEAIARMLENLTRHPIRLLGYDPPEQRFILAEGEAVATALILNEIIVNAVKHRAQGPADPGVCVSLRLGPRAVRIEVVNPGGLPADFDLDRRTGLGTGLELVCALLPKRGLVLTIRGDNGQVSSALTLSAPVIQVSGHEMGERDI